MSLQSTSLYFDTISPKGRQTRKGIETRQNAIGREVSRCVRKDAKPERELRRNGLLVLAPVTIRVRPKGRQTRKGIETHKKPAGHPASSAATGPKGRQTRKGIETAFADAAFLKRKNALSPKGRQTRKGIETYMCPPYIRAQGTIVVRKDAKPERELRHIRRTSPVRRFLGIGPKGRQTRKGIETLSMLTLTRLTLPPSPKGRQTRKGIETPADFECRLAHFFCQVRKDAKPERELRHAVSTAFRSPSSVRLSERTPNPKGN